jgi:hypothetical protein
MFVVFSINRKDYEPQGKPIIIISVNKSRHRDCQQSNPSAADWIPAFAGMTSFRGNDINGQSALINCI